MLANVWERDIASISGYDYSPALTKLSGRWTEKQLRAFLEDPESVAPGNAMPPAGLSGESLNAVIDALRDL